MSEVTKVRIRINRIKLENFLVKFGLVLFRVMVSVIIYSNVPPEGSVVNTAVVVGGIAVFLDLAFIASIFITWVFDEDRLSKLDMFILSNPILVPFILLAHILSNRLFGEDLINVFGKYNKHRDGLSLLTNRYTLADAKLILLVNDVLTIQEKELWYSSRNPYSEYMRIFNDSINNDYFIASGGSTLLSVLHDIKKLHLPTENDYESSVAKSILATQPLLYSIIKSIEEFETNEELQLKQMTEPVIARRAEIIDMLVKDSIEAQQTLMAYARK